MAAASLSHRIRQPTLVLTVILALTEAFVSQAPENTARIRSPSTLFAVGKRQRNPKKKHTTTSTSTSTAVVEPKDDDSGSGSSNDDEEPYSLGVRSYHHSKEPKPKKLRPVVKFFSQADTPPYSLGFQSSNNNNNNIVLDNTTVRVAKGQLWSGSFHRIQSMLTDNNNNTLEILQDWILVLNFLELLLELRSGGNNNNSNIQHVVASSSASSVEAQVSDNNNCPRNVTDMSEKDLFENIRNLLATISGTVCRQLEQEQKQPTKEDVEDRGCSQSSDDDKEEEKDDDDGKRDWYSRVMKDDDITDTSKTVNAKAMACFVWHALLRISNYYLRKRPKYLMHFWRCLTDMTLAFPEPVPFQWSVTAIKILLDYLQEGTLPTLQEPRSEVQTLRLKQICFFLNRLPTFFKKVPPAKADQCKMERFAHPLLLQFALWKGLEQCLPMSKVVTETRRNRYPEEELSSAAHKASKCFAAWYNVCRSLVKDPEWIPTLLQQPSPNANGDEDDEPQLRLIKEVTTQAVALGKCRFLLQALQIQVQLSHHKQEENMDPQGILKFVHLILFRAVPTCLQLQQQHEQSGNNGAIGGDGCCESFLAEGIPLLFQALNLVLERGDVETLQNTQKLVISWLGTASGERGHPLTREILILMTVQSIRSVNHIGGTHKEWCRLMVQLLFDTRAAASLRETLSNVLYRLLLHTDGHKDIQLQDHLQACLLESTQDLFSRFWKGDESTRSNKKKRKRSDPQPKNNSNKSVSVFAEMLGPIGKLLSILPSSKFNVVFDQWKKTQNRNFISKTSHTDDLLAMTLCVYCRQFDTSTTTAELLASCVSLQSVESTSKGNAVDALSLALLQLLGTRVQEDGTKMTLSAQEFQALADLLRLSTKNEKRKTVQLATIQAFGSIAKILPPNPVEDVLTRMAKYYKKCFSLSDWSRTCLALSSLSRFSQNDQTQGVLYKQMTNQCLPATAKTMMEARLNRTFQNTKQVQDTYAEALSTLAVDVPSQLFSKSLVINIAANGLVVEMSTGDAQKVPVLFNPGAESLQQIKYMLGESEDETPSGILQIKRASVDPQTGGLKLHVQAFSE